MRRLAVLALVPVLVLPAAPAQAADVEHTGANWTWTGPEAWTDAQGTFGITVSGGGKTTYDLGFSTTICSSGATYAKSVKKYFKGKRTSLTDAGYTLSNVSAIKTIGNDDYRRQTMNVTSAGRNGIKGVVELDYDFVQNDGTNNYCYTRTEARSAKKADYDDVKAKLAKVGRTIAYIGGGGYRDGE